MLRRPIPDLVAAFRVGTLPRDEWTHEAHLAVALVACREAASEEEALERMRRDIQRFNARTGVEEGPRSGYHETLTRFWVRAVASFAREHPGPLEEVFLQLLDFGGNARTPLRFWSKWALMDAAARAGWVEPDLRPLPFDAKDRKPDAC